MKGISYTDIDRNIWVDHSKAIGIILVVYGHVARGLFNAGIIVSDELYKLVDSIVYTFHMPLFFFLSGLFFCGSLNKRGIKGLLGSKVDTIVYPYLVWSVLQGVSEVYMSSYTNGTLNYSDVFSLLWEPRAQFWFLYALFMVFVVASVVFNKATDKFILPIFVGSIFLYVFQDNIPAYLYFNLHFNFISNNFVYFVFGVVLNKGVKFEIPHSRILLLITFFSFALSQYIYHIVLGLNFDDKGPLLLLVAVISILFIVSLSKELAKKPLDWLVFIGVSSMPIYLMHVFFTSGARIFMNKVADVNSVNAHLLIGCVIGIVGPLIAIYFMKRFKLTFLLSLPISKLIATKK